MAYSTLAQLRILSHFTPAEIADADVTALIAEADRAVLRLATIEVYNERLSGGIDGSNVLFTTKNKPLADTDFDSDVDADDVTVYLVDYDAEMNVVHTSTAVTSVNARDGIITLTTAPTTSNAEVGVYADYRFYNMPVDYDILKLAANYYLAHLSEMKIRTGRIENYPLSEHAASIADPQSSHSRWLTLAHSQLSFARPTLKLM